MYIPNGSFDNVILMLFPRKDAIVVSLQNSRLSKPRFTQHEIISTSLHEIHKKIEKTKYMIMSRLFFNKRCKKLTVFSIKLLSFEEKYTGKKVRSKMKRAYEKTIALLSVLSVRTSKAANFPHLPSTTDLDARERERGGNYFRVGRRASFIFKEVESKWIN